MTAQQKQAEELQRERAYEPRQRWQAILDAIAFAEENMPVEERRNRPRWHPAAALTTSQDASFINAARPSPDDSAAN